MLEVNNCLIIDTETNGDQEAQTVLEIGAVLYSVKHQTMLSCGSGLNVVSDDIFNQAELINRIPIEATRVAVKQQGFFEQWIQAAYEEADVIIAHNKNFDQPLVFGLPWAKNWEKPWLCTYQDFELFCEAYPGKRDLISLAQYYGIGISISHRAINDCLLLAEVFNRVPNLAEQFRIAQLPMVEAMCPKIDKSPTIRGFKWDYNQQGWFKKDKHETFDFPVIPVNENRQIFRGMVSYDDRQIAKDWGFSWNEQRRAWERLLSTEGAKLIPFQIVAIEPDPDSLTNAIFQGRRV